MRDGHHLTFWVYIIASPAGTLYVGVTGYFEKRIVQHKTGALEGFTKKYGCNRLVYYETYDEVGKALAREKRLKDWRRDKKITLLKKTNPRWEDLAEHVGSQMLFPGQSLQRTPGHGRAEDAASGFLDFARNDTTLASLPHRLPCRAIVFSPFSNCFECQHALIAHVIAQVD